jgi:hypothetical protein
LPLVFVVDEEPLRHRLAVDIAKEAGFATINAGNADESVAILNLAPTSPSFRRTLIAELQSNLGRHDKPTVLY